VIVFVAPVVVAIVVHRVLVGLRRAEEVEADRERALAEGGPAGQPGGGGG
jgi:hypothetical protein